MDRRTFLASAAASALVALPGRGTARLAVRAEGALDVTAAFGFVGDGGTDNYAAFHRLADAVNRQGGGRFVFPPGDYAVHQVRTEPFATRDMRAIRNATIIGADGLSLSGAGARIRLNGRFHRSARIGRDGVAEGLHQVHFMPFDIRRSRNVLIEGFEVDGGARDTTRDASVHEGYAHLVALNACTNVELRDLDLHHGLADGIFISDDVALSDERPGRVCRNVRLVRVKCRNNARGGLAPLQVLGLTASDCDFSGNGYPGRHGAHAPGFGVNVEPDRNNVGVDVDSLTGNLEFLRCTLFDNHSAILSAYLASYTGTCRFIDCSTRNGNDSDIHIIASWPGDGLLIQGGEHDAGLGAVHLSWHQRGGATRLRSLALRSRHVHGVMHGFAGNLAFVEDCDIIGTHDRAEGGNFIFFGQDPGGGRRNLFRGNRVFIPAARKRGGSGGQVESIFGHTDLIGNEYRTDLSRPGEYFVRHAVPGTTFARNERFAGAFRSA